MIFHIIPGSSAWNCWSSFIALSMLNLMSRSQNAVTICKGRLKTEGDSLVIYFAHQKNDHTQSMSDFGRHIYANPFNPEICPILSLGLYIVERGIFYSDLQQIFPGNKQGDRFNRILGDWLPDTFNIFSSRRYSD